MESLPLVVSRTQEAAPEGEVELDVTVLGPRTIEAKWTSPFHENGLLSYHVICSGLFYMDSDYWTTTKTSRDLLSTNITHEWVTVDGLLPFTDYIVKVTIKQVVDHWLI